MQLTRSYRSTYEIMTFAKRIQNITSLDAVKRHGEEPVLVACKSEQDEIRQVKDTIRNFEAGKTSRWAL